MDGEQWTEYEKEPVDAKEARRHADTWMLEHIAINLRGIADRMVARSQKEREQGHGK